MADFVFVHTVTGYGKQFRARDTVESESVVVLDGVTLPAAKTGDLTTRTDDDEGVITLDVGHGFSNGTYDIYWEDGCRYGVTLTIATNAATISGGTGAGDVLPADETAVTVALPVSEAFVVPASTAQYIIVKAPAGKQVVRFRTSAPANSLSVVERGTTEDSYIWNVTTGGTIPISTDAIATVLMSNGSSTATCTPDIVVGHTSA